MSSSPSVPVPISVSNTGTVYAGTLLSLTCDYTLNPSVDIVVAWMVNGKAVDTIPDRISTDGVTLSFSPVATSDSGRYTCELHVTTSQIHVTTDRSRQSAEDIIVQSNICKIPYLKVTCYVTIYLFSTQSPNLMSVSPSAVLLLSTLVVASLSHVL